MISVKFYLRFYEYVRALSEFVMEGISLLWELFVKVYDVWTKGKIARKLLEFEKKMITNSDNYGIIWLDIIPTLPKEWVCILAYNTNILSDHSVIME